MNKLIDLHTHTSYSDGEYTPDELIKLAIDKGIGTLAITDHDTVKGIKSINPDDYKEIKIIKGIELSAKTDRGLMHILGYGIDENNEILNDKLSEIRGININAVIRILEQMKKDYGIAFSIEDVYDLLNANHSIGRPDIAKLCVKYGYADSVYDAFKKYLIPAFNKIRKDEKGFSYQECINIIIASGGIPVLAHPTTLTLPKEELRELIYKMACNGLKGIEVYHSNQSKKESEFYLSLAQKYHLLVSGGSDFHGPNIKPDIELGTGKNNNLKIKSLSILPRLK
jgi:predicted metal-dependent phosphoesterase TrpH